MCNINSTYDRTMYSIERVQSTVRRRAIVSHFDKYRDNSILETDIKKGREIGEQKENMLGEISTSAY